MNSSSWVRCVFAAVLVFLAADQTAGRAPDPVYPWPLLSVEMGAVTTSCPTNLPVNTLVLTQIVVTQIIMTNVTPVFMLVTNVACTNLSITNFVTNVATTDVILSPLLLTNTVVTPVTLTDLVATNVLVTEIVITNLCTTNITSFPSFLTNLVSTNLLATNFVTTNLPTAGVRFASRTWSVVESGSSVAIGLERIGDTNAAVSVTVTTMDQTALAGSDYAATTVTAIFPPGVTHVDVRVPVLDDSIPETNETVLLTLSAPVQAVLLAPCESELTVVDDDLNADLALGKTSLRTTLRLGETNEWTLTLRNNGLATATNIVVEDRLPGAVTPITRGRRPAPHGSTIIPNGAFRPSRPARRVRWCSVFARSAPAP